MNPFVENPLVSVCVVTYNSSETILETLDSIYRQSYSNIELILSDDCSMDDTVSVCEEWIAIHMNRFVNVRLLKVSGNTGVTANLNRAINEAKGIWIKTLAGDDLLEATCIEECIRFVYINRCRICMVKMSLFGGDPVVNKKTEKLLEEKYRILKMGDREKQFKEALYRHILPGPGIFYSRELWEEIGGFDENYRDFEEYAFELKVFRIEKVFFLDKALVKWRQRDGSLTHTAMSPATKNDIRFYKEVRRPLIKENHLYLELIDRDLYYYVVKKTEFEGGSRMYKLALFLSPLHVVRVCKG